MASKVGHQTFIVDNNAQYHELFEKAFKEERPSTQVKFFFSGHQLLDHLNDKSQAFPSLLLLDLFLPEMDAITTLSHIRETPRLVRLPIVIMGPVGLTSHLLRSYQAGANSYVDKPQDYDALKHFVDVTCSYWLDVAQKPSSPGLVY